MFDEHFYIGLYRVLTQDLQSLELTEEDEALLNEYIAFFASLTQTVEDEAA